MKSMGLRDEQDFLSILRTRAKEKLEDAREEGAAYGTVVRRDHPHPDDLIRLLRGPEAEGGLEFDDLFVFRIQGERTSLTRPTRMMKMLRAIHERLKKLSE